MNSIKTHIFNHFNTLVILTSAIVFSLFILLFRVKFTHSFHFLFLVWNLFLAIIPYLISTFLINQTKPNKIGLILSLGVWLLFLPNAPYILTDLFHLKISNWNIIWLDLIVIVSFALTGLLLFYLTILDIKTLLHQHFNKKVAQIAFCSLFFLSSFGIYLGRFLRYNSWEIVNNPKTIFKDILSIILNPLENKKAWLFTLLFGFFLSIGFVIFKRLAKLNVE